VGTGSCQHPEYSACRRSESPEIPARHNLQNPLLLGVLKNRMLGQEKDVFSSQIKPITLTWNYLLFSICLNCTNPGMGVEGPQTLKLHRMHTLRPTLKMVFPLISPITEGGAEERERERENVIAG
jgi:hypothetical protein